MNIEPTISKKKTRAEEKKKSRRLSIFSDQRRLSVTWYSEKVNDFSFLFQST
ncbi:hypothetical protein YC2023_076007 [Brassica napus]